MVRHNLLAFFSAPEMITRLSVVCVNLSHLQLLLWNCWIEFAKLDRKQELNVYQVCVFHADPKTNMAALASD